MYGEQKISQVGFVVIILLFLAIGLVPVQRSYVMVQSVAVVPGYLESSPSSAVYIIGRYY